MKTGAMLTILSQQLTGAVVVTNQAKKLYKRAFEHETALRKALVKAQMEYNKERK